MRYAILSAIVVVALLLPTPAYACSGWVDCLFGFTERTEVRSAAETEQARIDAQAQAEIARIEGEQAERLRMADAEVERVRQLQYESEAQRDIAIAQTQASVDQYKASIQALVDEKTENIRAGADTQIAALQGQAQIAIAGITETGSTERYRIAGGWIFATVAIALVALLIVSAMRRQPRQVVLLPHERAALPWVNDEIELREVKHEYIVKR
jgi:hypothetical protein